ACQSCSPLEHPLRWSLAVVLVLAISLHVCDHGVRGLQHFVSSYTRVESASMTSSRIGNCALIVIYGWRYPARSVPALYSPLGHMLVRVVAWLCPRLKPGHKGCSHRRDTEEQRHGRSTI